MSSFSVQIFDKLASNRTNFIYYLLLLLLSIIVEMVSKVENLLDCSNSFVAFSELQDNCGRCERINS